MGGERRDSGVVLDADRDARTHTQDASSPTDSNLEVDAHVDGHMDGGLDAPAEDAADRAAECASYCACVTGYCTEAPDYFYTSVEECLTRCATLPEENLDCWAAWCADGTQYTSWIRIHACEHALGALGTIECPHMPLDAGLPADAGFDASFDAATDAEAQDAAFDAAPADDAGADDAGADDAGAEDAGEPLPDSGPRDAGPPRTCDEYCDCNQSQCSSWFNYPYASRDACMTACLSFEQAGVDCWTMFCELAPAAGVFEHHMCKHSWGLYGLLECY